MSVQVVVLVCGIAAALLSFALSASHTFRVDAVDPAVEVQAVRRSLIRHPRVIRFIRERMDRKTAGGFMLTASFVVLFVVAFVVGSLLNMIRHNAWLENADRSVAAWGSRHGTSDTAQAMKWVTQLGSTIGVTVMLTVTAGIDYLRRRKLGVVAFLAAVGIGQLILSNVLKLVVHRERPSVLRLVVANGYSFPSGHTVAAASATSAIAFIIGTGRSRLVRATLAGAAALIAISVATSRALLGVHWLSDVIAGLAIGWGWFMIVAIIFGGRAQRLGEPLAIEPQRVST
jgi:undecaprenyl-diphosphatase